MKLRNFFILAIIIAVAASCNPSYKATDRTRSSTDSTGATTDSTAMDRNSTDTMSSMDQSTPSTDTMSNNNSNNNSDNNNNSNSDNSNSNNNSTSTDSMSNNQASSSAVTVPENLRTTFATQYPNAANATWSNYDTLSETPIDWEMAGWNPLQADDYVVRFDMDNENYYAWYDNEGNWIGSTSPLKDVKQLPPAVSTVVTSKYADYTVANVDREFQKDRVAYEIKLTKQSDNSKVKLLVDADGNIIKEKLK